MVPEGVLCQNEAFQVGISASNIHDALKLEISGISAHSLNYGFRGAEVPEFKARRRVQVCVDSSNSNVVALVASTT